MVAYLISKALHTALHSTQKKKKQNNNKKNTPENSTHNSFCCNYVLHKLKDKYTENIDIVARLKYVV